MDKVYTILIMFIVLILLDKSITALSIHTVMKKHPNINPYQVEKNPLAKIFFERTGLFWGSIGMSIISLVLLYVAYFLFTSSFGYVWGLWCCFMLYSLVICNNIYWFLNYSGVLV